MEFVEGVPINQIDKIKKMGLNLSEVAKLLGNTFSNQIFNYGYVHGDPHPGNIYVNSQKNKNGDIEPQLILLDHGIYTELNNTTRLQYSYLWKGILTQNEALIKDASEKLGVQDFWGLFAAMIVSKTYDDIMNNQEKNVHDRLKMNNTKEEKDKLQSLAQQFHKEITFVLHNCNK